VPRGGALHVRVAPEGEAAVLLVSDTGPGIAPELHARLFQPFSPGDPRRGSGLGLTICHEIVRTLGGSIALKNRVQGGEVRGLDATVNLPSA
jgi:two-component system sensor histidine kinase TctE